MNANYQLCTIFVEKFLSLKLLYEQIVEDFDIYLCLLWNDFHGYGKDFKGHANCVKWKN